MLAGKRAKDSGVRQLMLELVAACQEIPQPFFDRWNTIHAWLDRRFISPKPTTVSVKGIAQSTPSSNDWELNSFRFGFERPFENETSDADSEVLSRHSDDSDNEADKIQIVIPKKNRAADSLFDDAKSDSRAEADSKVNNEDVFSKLNAVSHYGEEHPILWVFGHVLGALFGIFSAVTTPLAILILCGSGWGACVLAGLSLISAVSVYLSLGLNIVPGIFVRCFGNFTAPIFGNEDEKTNFALTFFEYNYDDLDTMKNRLIQAIEKLEDPERANADNGERWETVLKLQVQKIFRIGRRVYGTYEVQGAKLLKERHLRMLKELLQYNGPLQDDLEQLIEKSADGDLAAFESIKQKLSGDIELRKKIKFLHVFFRVIAGAFNTEHLRETAIVKLANKPVDGEISVVKQVLIRIIGLVFAPATAITFGAFFYFNVSGLLLGALGVSVGASTGSFTLLGMAVASFGGLVGFTIGLLLFYNAALWVKRFEPEDFRWFKYRIEKVKSMFSMWFLRKLCYTTLQLAGLGAVLLWLTTAALTNTTSVLLTLGLGASLASSVAITLIIIAFPMHQLFLYSAIGRVWASLKKEVKAFRNEWLRIKQTLPEAFRELFTHFFGSSRSKVVSLAIFIGYLAIALIIRSLILAMKLITIAVDLMLNDKAMYAAASTAGPLNALHNQGGPFGDMPRFLVAVVTMAFAVLQNFSIMFGIRPVVPNTRTQLTEREMPPEQTPESHSVCFRLSKAAQKARVSPPLAAIDEESVDVMDPVIAAGEEEPLVAASPIFSTQARAATYRYFSLPKGLARKADESSFFGHSRNSAERLAAAVTPMHRIEAHIQDDCHIAVPCDSFTPTINPLLKALFIKEPPVSARALPAF